MPSDKDYIDSFITKIKGNITLGKHLIDNILSCTYIHEISLNLIASAIVEAFYECYTGEEGFINIDYLFES